MFCSCCFFHVFFYHWIAAWNASQREMDRFYLLILLWVHKSCAELNWKRKLCIERSDAPYEVCVCMCVLFSPHGNVVICHGNFSFCMHWFMRSGVDVSVCINVHFSPYTHWNETCWLYPFSLIIWFDAFSGSCTMHIYSTYIYKTDRIKSCMHPSANSNVIMMCKSHTLRPMHIHMVAQIHMHKCMGIFCTHCKSLRKWDKKTIYCLIRKLRNAFCKRIHSWAN